MRVENKTHSYFCAHYGAVLPESLLHQPKIEPYYYVYVHCLDAENYY